MDINILKVKGFNALIYAFVVVQLALLIGIVTLLISVMSEGFATIDTVISSVLLFMLGLPLFIMLYRSSQDPVMRVILRGLIYSYALLSASGIIWYVIAGAFGIVWLVSVAKILMVTSYVPISLALYTIYSASKARLSGNLKTLVTYICVVSILVITFFSIVNSGGGDWFATGIYVSSIFMDILILALVVMLVLIYAPTRLRYTFSALFVYTTLSFIGDFLSLARSLQTFNVPVAPEVFYSAMLLFAVAAAFLYLFLKDVSSTTVEEVNKRLHDTRHAMDDLILQMPYAACVFSTEGDAVMVNDPFLKIFGKGRDDIVGKFNLFKHSELLNCDMGRKIPLLKKGDSIAIEKADVQFRGGRRAYISMKLFPTFCQDGAVSGYISICEDVTARVRADEELKHAKELGELYIDLMGHDINNMNQVGMGYLELALDTLGAGDDKKPLLLKPLEAMRNSSRLIENVKKLRRANEGDMYLRPVDLDKLIKDVIAEHGQAPGREVAISYEPADNAMVMANELLKDVFVNLVSNAIKHSSGTVHIDIRREATEAGGRRLYRITLEDDGPGIPQELKPVVFDRILRSRARIGGNGIGLYLVKTLIDNFGGSIAVEDRMPGELNRGTRFIVILPAA